MDIGSFERLREGEAWVGYRQFCMLYLYPLLLQSVKDVAFHPWLRGSIDGIRPREMRAVMSFRDRFRKGLYTNVFLHAKLEQRYADRGGEVKTEMKRAGFKKEIIVANVRKMRKLIERLTWDPPEGVWVAYGERNSYTDDDAKRKDEFVREVSTSREWDLVWDIGANNGRYSRIAAEGAKTVLAIDADQGPVELLYRTLRDEGNEQILHAHDEPRRPLAGARLARPRAQGAARSRQARPGARARADPPRRDQRERAGQGVRRLARDLGSALVIEFPTREDPMVQEAARAQARRPAPRLRPRVLRALPERGVRGRALRAPGVRHPGALLRAPQGGMSRPRPRRRTQRDPAAGHREEALLGSHTSPCCRRFASPSRCSTC